MKPFITFFCCCLLLQQSLFAQELTAYTKITPLVKTYLGEKIKFVMAQYKNNKVIVATKKYAYTITKKEAADAGIIPQLPKIKNFAIDGDIYTGIVNVVDIKEVDSSSERIVSDDASIYLDREINKYNAESFLPDTAIFYKINTKTFDTVGICIKPILNLPSNESIHPQVSFGNMDNKIVTIELLRQQKEIKTPPGYTLIKATLYFSGIDNMVYARYITSKDLAPLKSIIDSCKDGSTIVTDNVMLKSPTGRMLHVMVPSIKVGMKAPVFDFTSPDFQFGSISFTRVESGRFKRQKRVFITNGFKFISAQVYFGGAGFSNIETALLQQNSTVSIANLLQRCVPGTIVTFDNIKVETPNDGVRVIDGKSYSLF